MFPPLLKGLYLLLHYLVHSHTKLFNIPVIDGKDLLIKMLKLPTALMVAS
jgi:hypothetical protein